MKNEIIFYEDKTKIESLFGSFHDYAVILKIIGDKTLEIKTVSSTGAIKLINIHFKNRLTESYEIYEFKNVRGLKIGKCITKNIEYYFKDKKIYINDSLKNSNNLILTFFDDFKLTNRKDRICKLYNIQCIELVNFKYNEIYMIDEGSN